MKVVVLDTETTGLVYNHSVAIDKQPEMIEFFATHLDLQKAKYGKKYETLVRPRIWPMTEKTILETRTKLTNEMLKDAPLFKAVAPALKKFIEEAPVIVAHNAAFDKEMLGIEFERIGMQVEWPPLICTVEQTIHMKGYRLSLTNLHVELFKKPFPEAHRAKNDVMALTKCCIELYKRNLL